MHSWWSGQQINEVSVNKIWTVMIMYYFENTSYHLVNEIPENEIGIHMRSTTANNHLTTFTLYPKSYINDK